MNQLPLFFITLLFCCLLMVAVWKVALRIKNAGIVDIAWAFAFVPLALLYRFLVDGEPVRQNLITLMVLAWSLRLGIHLWKGFRSQHPAEDGRYQELRRGVSGHEGFFFFWYFQAQGVLLALVSLPILLSSFDSRIELCFSDVLGFLIWLVAMGGEALADHQLAVFKRNPSNQGKVCSSGLWHYSRHPNYFFEFLIWIAFFFYAFPAPWGLLSILSPALMLGILLGVTGIPYAEEQALRSRGEAYRAYQRTTSAFFPWFPKRPIS